MTDEHSETPRPPRRGRATAIIAWLAIFGLVGWILSVQMKRRAEPQQVTGSDSLEFVMLEVQSKYMVGVANWFGDAAASQIEGEMENWPTDSEGQAVRVAIVAGELAGAEEAIDRLSRMEASDLDEGTAGEAPDSTLAEASEILKRAYQDYLNDELTTPSITEDERQSLIDELGWFGRLALNPDGVDEESRAGVVDPAKRIVVGLLSFAVLWSGLAILGIGVILFTVVRLWMRAERRFDSSPRHGRFYVEAFAIWMIAYPLLGSLAAMVAPAGFGMLSAFGAGVISLATVAWPRLRGVPWRDIFDDLGWTRGKGLLRELIAGVGCYTTALPLIVTAYVITAIVMTLFGQSFELDHSSAHPIAQQQIGASFWKAFQLFALASVMAPILEETMFRGFLYRHLREASHRVPLFLSLPFSALVNSTVFALIHPQGFLALPALGAIAIALSLSREYRDSLIAPIVGHAINNTVTLSLLFFMFAG